MTGIAPSTKLSLGYGPQSICPGADRPWPQVYAATTERIVADRHTGLAISGFDPVAYFTDAVPRMGRRGA